MPPIAGFITDPLEGKLQNELRHVVCWRPGMAVDRGWRSTQNRFGGPGKVMDSQDFKADEWTKIHENIETKL